MATSSLTGASLFRETDANHWTVIWDEADTTFHKNTNPELIGVFNAGHSLKFAVIQRQVPRPNGEFVTRTFDTFTGIALAMLHVFPSRAMQSRCIVLPMKRATKAEAARLEELSEEHEAALEECGRKAARWAADLPALPTVSKADTGLINRIWLNWRPLLQIAELAGGTWPARALAAARADMARVQGEKDDSAEYALLNALWWVFAADSSDPRRIHTRDIIPRLLNHDEGRWRTANRGKEIDDYYLRDKLKKLLPTEGPFSKSKSRRWRPNNDPKANPLNGYHELHLEDAFARYLARSCRRKRHLGPRMTQRAPVQSTFQARSRHLLRLIYPL
jgi:putative DNA primase/helicase